MVTREKKTDFEKMGNKEFERQLFGFAESFIDACLDKVRARMSEDATGVKIPADNKSESFNVSGLGMSQADSEKRGKAVFDALMGLGRGDGNRSAEGRLRCTVCENDTLRLQTQLGRTGDTGRELIVPAKCEICKAEREIIYELPEVKKIRKKSKKA